MQRQKVKVFTWGMMLFGALPISHPKFNYCVEATRITYATFLDPYVELKMALRIITSRIGPTHLIPLYGTLKLLQFPEIHMYSVQLWMYK